jgi:CRP/FNR family cyclic AMP-dependent transcriptional regulator
MKDSQISLHELLARSHYTEGLSPEVVGVLADIARLVNAPTGTILFEEGSHQDEIFVLSSGRAALEMNVPRRGRVRLLTVGAGELLGWSELIDEGTMTSTAVVTKDATLVGLSSRRLLELCEQDPKFGYMLMKQTAKAVSRRLVATRLQLLDLYSETEPTTEPSDRIQGSM